MCYFYFFFPEERAHSFQQNFRVFCDPKRLRELSQTDSTYKWILSFREGKELAPGSTAPYARVGSSRQLGALSITPQCCGPGAV